ncbi:MAG TPA: hypothetical protein VE398_10290 [Acidobacteriota bacterium]|nr:hypothetical protein [Acidobacteriota bacterium]
MNRLNRRVFLGRSLGLCTGVAAGISYEDQTLLAQLVNRSEYGIKKTPVKGLQHGKLGNYEISRLIIGGNLISGSAHAGDLLYQSALMTHYFTTEKILETWALAEENGINTTLMRADPHIIEHYRKFTRERGGKLQWIAQSAPEQGDPVENAKRARDNGALAMYLHGGVSDKLAKAGKTEEIGSVLAGIKQAGILGGIGAHELATVQACVRAGLNPDFYMFTINKLNYYSSNPAEVAAFMKGIEKPWIGFKVLGAGRDKPPDGFLHAFQQGADFICVGMFDWQVRDDTAMVQEMLAKGISRDRLWLA